MTPVETLRGQSVALFGLGGSGLSTARALVAGGAEVAAWDDSPAARERAEAAGVALVDLAQADWRGFRVFVLAPGVPLTHPKPHWTVNLADEAGVPIIGDIELFVRERGVESAGRAVRRDHRHQRQIDDHGAHRPCAQGGRARSRDGRQHRRAGSRSAAARRRAASMSSNVRPIRSISRPRSSRSVGLLINITPDHLDRHGDLARYAAIKERLVAQAEVALVGVDDEPCRDIYARLKARAGAPRAPCGLGERNLPLADVWVSEHRVMAQRRSRAGGRSCGRTGASRRP